MNSILANMPSPSIALPVVIAFALAAPVQAQHSGHTRDPAPACTPEHAAMGHCTMPASHQHDAPAKTDAGDPGCTPEHAAMGHCTMPTTPRHALGHDAASTEAVDPRCPPEHAAMGHCTPRRPGPTEPREPIPELTDEDRAAAFPHLHGGHAHGSDLHWLVRFNRFEAWDADPGNGQAWSGSAWLGGDVNRLRLKSSGERSGGRTASSSAHALYSRSVTPWWDLVAGVKQEFRPDSRTWGAIGVEGLAPYMFEISAIAYVGSGGQAQLKVEAEYEVLLTNRLILQPLVEATASLKSEPEAGIGSGLGKLEAGLRLRYEITRRFAPYLGVAHERAIGNTADIARANGGHLRDTRVVAGIRFWF